jgi:hypothetical protein
MRLEFAGLGMDNISRMGCYSVNRTNLTIHRYRIILTYTIVQSSAKATTW